MKKKFKVVALGCKTNQYETVLYKNQLEHLGWQEAKKHEEADLCIVNSCTVTAHATTTSLYQIKSLRKKNPKAKIVLTGCFSEKSPEKIQKIDQTIEIFPNAQKHHLIKTLLGQETPDHISHFSGHTRAFLKIQDGCNHFCSYCIVPFLRGEPRSRSIEEIFLEAQKLVENGHQEIVLTGINLGLFSDHSKNHPALAHRDLAHRGLATLVEELGKIKDLKRIRLSSIHPHHVTQELEDLIVNKTKLMPSLHISLQSGSNRVLRDMNRKYTREEFIQLVKRLHKKNPDFTVTTDVIVGFPTEEEQDFEDTIDLIKTLPFIKVHVFSYSPRKGTQAENLYRQRNQETVNSKHINVRFRDIVEQRKAKIEQLVREITFQVRQKFVGRRMKVLLESTKSSIEILGHAENFLEVMLPRKNCCPNQIVVVEITENTKEGILKGKIA